MSLWLVFVLLSLATFRLTRLITRDDFPPIYAARRWICQLRAMRWKQPIWVKIPGTNAPDPKPGAGVQEMQSGRWDYWTIGELVTCPWCASAYVAAGSVACYWAVYGLPAPVLWWLAVWGAGAALAALAE